MKCSTINVILHRARSTALLSILYCSFAEGATFIVADSVSSTSPNGFSTPAALIGEASDINYVAPDPVVGGGGTSWWTGTLGNTNVEIIFDFNTSTDISIIHIWDYYFHTPSNWTISLYDGAGGSGNLLNNDSFDLGALTSRTWQQHEINFSLTNNVSSAVLTSQSNSFGGGVGLAEVAFGASALVPEPSSLTLIALGGLSLCMRRKRR